MTRNLPLFGVIEGFYGRPWDDAARLQIADWLPRIGIDRYLYAPKADAFLRRNWTSPWPEDRAAHLRALAERCAGSGLGLFFGLSPYALYERYGAEERAILKRKVRELTDYPIAGLALLFDDMPGGVESLAARQLEIIDDVIDTLGNSRLLVCPTYYSDDPVLDRVFGERPAGYLEALMRGLGTDTGLFWTGPQVCSERITPGDLASLLCDRGPGIELWDNYPVNDSKLRSAHLYMDALSGRESTIGEHLTGHWCNAMNQPALSLPALSSLPALYGRDLPDRAAVFEAAGLTAELIKACRPLARSSREEVTPAQLRDLEQCAAGATPAARELADWMAGEYTFDPACLTD